MNVVCLPLQVGSHCEGVFTITLKLQQLELGLAQGSNKKSKYFRS